MSLSTLFRQPVDQQCSRNISRVNTAYGKLEQIQGRISVEEEALAQQTAQLEQLREANTAIADNGSMEKRLDAKEWRLMPAMCTSIEFALSFLGCGYLLLIIAGTHRVPVVIMGALGLAWGAVKVSNRWAYNYFGKPANERDKSSRISLAGAALPFALIFVCDVFAAGGEASIIIICIFGFCIQLFALTHAAKVHQAQAEKMLRREIARIQQASRKINGSINKLTGVFRKAQAEFREYATLVVPAIWQLNQQEDKTLFSTLHLRLTNNVIWLINNRVYFNEMIPFHLGEGGTIRLNNDAMFTNNWLVAGWDNTINTDNNGNGLEQAALGGTQATLNGAAATPEADAATNGNDAPSPAGNDPQTDTMRTEMPAPQTPAYAAAEEHLAEPADEETTATQPTFNPYVGETEI